MNPNLKKWLDQRNATRAARMACGYNAITHRESMANFARDFVTDIPPVPFVFDAQIETQAWNVPVRIYHPQPEQALPVFLFFHGGGGMGGSVSVYDPLCRKFALAANAIVVSVEYRLTPENPYPCSVDDAIGCAQNLWPALEKLAHRKELIVGGDSFGGTLAALVAQRAQVEIQKAVLIYPSLDFTLSFPSVETLGTGYFLEKQGVTWIYNSLFRHGEDRRAASPLFGRFSQNMPKTLVISGGYDPLKDENSAYCERLKESGVPFRHEHFEGMIHGFLLFEDMVPQECRKAYKVIGDFVKG